MSAAWHDLKKSQLRPSLPRNLRAFLLRLQDYVKWRGPLFHRFLLALVDESPSVCSLAEYLLSDTLASKVGSAPLEGCSLGFLVCWVPLV